MSNRRLAPRTRCVLDALTDEFAAAGAIAVRVGLPTRSRAIDAAPRPPTCWCAWGWQSGTMMVGGIGGAGASPEERREGRYVRHLDHSMRSGALVRLGRVVTRTGAFATVLPMPASALTTGDLLAQSLVIEDDLTAAVNAYLTDPSTDSRNSRWGWPTRSISSLPCGCTNTPVGP